MSCHEWNPLLSGYIDAELTPDEVERLKNHLSHCSGCRHELQALREIDGATNAMKRDHDTLPDAFWDQYWLSVYNRMERGLGWILLSVGGTALLSFGLWHFVTRFLLEPSAPLIVRIGMGLSALGVAVLGMSVGRERLRGWHHDPYKEVKR